MRKLWPVKEGGREEGKKDSRPLVTPTLGALRHRFSSSSWLALCAQRRFIFLRAADTRDMGEASTYSTYVLYVRRIRAVHSTVQHWNLPNRYDLFVYAFPPPPPPPSFVSLPMAQLFTCLSFPPPSLLIEGSRNCVSFLSLSSSRRKRKMGLQESQQKRRKRKKKIGMMGVFLYAGRKEQSPLSFPFGACGGFSSSSVLMP